LISTGNNWRYDLHKRAGHGSFDSVHIAAMADPSYAQRMEMKQLVNFSELAFDAVNAALVSTRSYLAQNRDTATVSRAP